MRAALALLAVASCHRGDGRFPLAIDLPTTATWTIGDTTIETVEGGHDRAWVEDRIRGEGRDVIGSEPIDGGWRVRAADRASRVIAYTYRTVGGVGLLCGADDADRCAAIRSPSAQELTIPVANGERITWGGLVLAIGDGACTVEHDRDGMGPMLCRGLHAR